MRRPYTLIRLLSKGDYGEVWIARDADGHVYALKKLFERSASEDAILLMYYDNALTRMGDRE